MLIKETPVGTTLMASSARAKQCAVLITHQFIARSCKKRVWMQLAQFIGRGRHTSGPYEFITSRLGDQYQTALRFFQKNRKGNAPTNSVGVL